MAHDSSEQLRISPALTRTASAKPSFRLRSQSLNSVRLRRVFDIFDRNGDGDITVAELSLALDRLGLAADSTELSSAVSAYIRPGRSGLDFDDFMAFHSALGEALISGSGVGDDAQSEEEESDMREAFAVFDVNRDGYISAAELQAVLQKLGLMEGRSLDGVQRMISAVDRDNDGRVDFSEFRNMMRNVELSIS